MKVRDASLTDSSMVSLGGTLLNQPTTAALLLCTNLNHCKTNVTLEA